MLLPVDPLRTTIMDTHIGSTKTIAPTPQSCGTARTTLPRPARTHWVTRRCSANVSWGLLCSIPGPGGLIIQTLDAICAPRDAGATAIGGFHSPLEPECLDRPPRGEQPAILGRR
jgi:hypothetical protein